MWLGTGGGVPVLAVTEGPTLLGCDLRTGGGVRGLAVTEELGARTRLSANRALIS